MRYNNTWPVRDPVPMHRSSVGSSEVAAPAPESLPVTILYGDVRAGLQALRLVAGLGGRFKFDPQLWQLALLEQRTWRNVVATELAVARFVILAPGDAGLSATVEHWLAEVVERRSDDPPRVIELGAFGEGCIAGLDPAEWDSPRIESSPG